MRTFTIVATIIVCGPILLFGSSCDKDSNPQDIIGRWRDTADYHGWYDKFEIENDLEGEGQFLLYYDEDIDEVVWDDYDVKADGDGDTWVIDAEAEDGAEYDFEMECERNGDNLQCTCSNGYCADLEWTFEPN